MNGNSKMTWFEKVVGRHLVGDVDYETISTREPIVDYNFVMDELSKYAEFNKASADSSTTAAYALECIPKLFDKADFKSKEDEDEFVSKFLEIISRALAYHIWIRDDFSSKPMEDGCKYLLDERKVKVKGGILGFDPVLSFYYDIHAHIIGMGGYTTLTQAWEHCSITAKILSYAYLTVVFNGVFSDLVFIVTKGFNEVVGALAVDLSSKSMKFNCEYVDVGTLNKIFMDFADPNDVDIITFEEMNQQAVETAEKNHRVAEEEAAKALDDGADGLGDIPTIYANHKKTPDLDRLFSLCSELSIREYMGDHEVLSLRKMFDTICAFISGDKKNLPRNLWYSELSSSLKDSLLPARPGVDDLVLSKRGNIILTVQFDKIGGRGVTITCGDTVISISMAM